MDKKAFANGIVSISKKIKISILLGFVWFIGFSIYNGLVQYSIFDKQFEWFEAEKILGSRPSQYNFILDENKINDIDTKDNKFLDSIASTKKFKEWQDKKMSISKISAPVNEYHSGSIIISESGYLEVKKEIVNHLLEESLIFSLIMIPITFVIMTSIFYIRKGIKWTNKYSD